MGRLYFPLPCHSQPSSPLPCTAGGRGGLGRVVHVHVGLLQAVILVTHESEVSNMLLTSPLAACHADKRGTQCSGRLVLLQVTCLSWLWWIRTTGLDNSMPRQIFWSAQEVLPAVFRPSGVPGRSPHVNAIVPAITS